jgi:hypothetical protein
MRYLGRVIKMFWINIFDNTTNKTWREEFESYYLFKKRVNKLRFSKKLQVTSRSNLLD